MKNKKSFITYGCKQNMHWCRNALYFLDPKMYIFGASTAMKSGYKL